MLFRIYMFMVCLRKLVTTFAWFLYSFRTLDLLWKSVNWEVYVALNFELPFITYQTFILVSGLLKTPFLYFVLN